MSTTVHVANISKQTSEKEVRDFFSFCGKISNISITPASDDADATQSATVNFEKETAAKTALLLDNTQLGGSQVHVSSAASLDDLGAKPAQEAEGGKDDGDLRQEDKPRSRIVAEYLAQGYTLSDGVIERAIQLDQQHGISARFTAALKQFDARLHATERAQAVDSKYGVTDRAMGAWRGLNSYFERALGTPTGQRLRKFYEEGNKQVVDVHNEARHLADLKAGKSSGSNNNNNNNTLETVPGTDRTKCNCAADEGNCPCEPGKCACASCGKNPEANSSANEEKTVPGSF